MVSVYVFTGVASPCALLAARECFTNVFCFLPCFSKNAFTDFWFASLYPRYEVFLLPIVRIACAYGSARIVPPVVHCYDNRVFPDAVFLTTFLTDYVESATEK